MPGFRVSTAVALVVPSSKLIEVGHGELIMQAEVRHRCRRRLLRRVDVALEIVLPGCIAAVIERLHQHDVASFHVFSHSPSLPSSKAFIKVTWPLKSAFPPDYRRCRRRRLGQGVDVTFEVLLVRLARGFIGILQHLFPNSQQVHAGSH